MALIPAHRHACIAAVSAALAVLAGCGSGPPPAKPGTISEDAFVRTYVSLRLAAWEASEQLEFEERKAEILARDGLDENALPRFLEAHEDDVRYLARLWRRVEDEMQRALEELHPEPDEADPAAPDRGRAPELLQPAPLEPRPRPLGRPSPPPEHLPAPPATREGNPVPDPYP